jgi:hypothetical protein
MPTIMGNIEALFKGINQGIHKQMMKQTVKKKSSNKSATLYPENGTPVDAQSRSNTLYSNRKNM